MKSLCPKDISIRLLDEVRLGMWNFVMLEPLKFVSLTPFQMGKTEARRGCHWAGYATGPWWAGPSFLALTLSAKVFKGLDYSYLSYGVWAIQTRRDDL